MSAQCPLCGSAGAALHARVGEWRYFQCAGCRLTFRDPAQLPGADEERRHYALHENRSDDLGYRSFLERLAGPLGAVLPPGSAGLDFGSGPGPTLSLMLTERGFPTGSYDPFFAPAEGVLERRYDFVTCTEVVEHLHRPREVFLRLDALLQPGGWLGVMTELRRPERGFERWWYVRDPTHVAFYERRTFDWIATWLGWRVGHAARNVILLRKP